MFKETIPGYLTTAGAYGVSNSGVIVGDYEIANGGYFEFGALTYGNGILNKFAYPVTQTHFLPSGINNDGTIILSSPQSSVGYIGKPGMFTPVAFPGATQTTLNAINDAGVVVGSYIASNGSQHGFLYRPDGTYSSFDGPFYAGVSSTELTGIDNNGDLVGVTYSSQSAFQTPFVFTNGAFESLFGGRPTGINDNGQILLPAAYLGLDEILDYKTNTLEIISQNANYPVLQSLQARINDSGVIVGGDTGYMLLPIPEPATYLLTLPILAGLMFWRLKSRDKQAISAPASDVNKLAERLNSSGCVH